MYCTYCNFKNESSSKFCESCGKPLNETLADTQPFIRRIAKNKDDKPMSGKLSGGKTLSVMSRFKIVFVILLGAIVIFLGAIVIVSAFMFFNGKAPALGLGVGSTLERPADGMTMLYVPAGEFEMGSNDGNRDEKPIHTVYLDAYWIDETEVTNAMHHQCAQAGVCDEPNCYDYDKSAYLDHPVTCMDWHDAKTYCEWAGGRLPTEAEWEKAARGPDGRIYPWGDTLDRSYANFFGGDTTAVGSYESGKSFYGAYDMAGNVYEWVDGWYDYYDSSSGSDLAEPITDGFRVLRGGSWSGLVTFIRSTHRYGIDPKSTGGLVGFRCSRTP